MRLTHRLKSMNVLYEITIVIPDESEIFMSQRWALYIDESGNYDCHKELTTLAGVLIRLPKDNTLDEVNEDLQARIGATLPELSWPPHATLTNKNPMWFLWNFLYYRKNSSPEVLGWVEATLQRLSPREREQLAISLGQDLELKYKLAQKFERAAYKALHGADRIRMNQFATEKRNVLETLFKESGLDSYLAFVTDQPLPVEPRQTNQPDRYTTQLICLFERVRDAILSIPGEHKLDICVADRYVAHLEHDYKRKMMNFEHCQAAYPHISEAMDWQQPERLTKITFATRTYGKQSTPALLAYADYIANKVRKKLKEGGQVEVSDLSVVSSKYGLSIKAPESEQYTMAITGDTQACLNTYRQGEMVHLKHEHEVLSQLPSWGQTQYNNWKTYFEKEGEI